MNHPRSGVLFDLDGTLVDSNYLHTLAWSRALADNGEWAPMNVLHRRVGMGGDHLVAEVLGHPPGVLSEYRARRYRELRGEVRAFPGAAELCRATKAAGLRVVLATSAPGEEMRSALEVLGGADLFDLVTTADDATSSKPDPEIFLNAMERAGLDPERTVAVGDSIWDVRAARAAGIGCIGVESGGFSRHELDEDGALAVYRSADELRSRLRTSPIGVLALWAGERS